MNWGLQTIYIYQEPQSFRSICLRIYYRISRRFIHEICSGDIFESLARTSTSLVLLFRALTSVQYPQHLYNQFLMVSCHNDSTAIDEWAHKTCPNFQCLDIVRKQSTIFSVISNRTPTTSRLCICQLPDHKKLKLSCTCSSVHSHINWGMIFCMPYAV